MKIKQMVEKIINHREKILQAKKLQKEEDKLMDEMVASLNQLNKVLEAMNSIEPTPDNLDKLEKFMSIAEAQIEDAGKKAKEYSEIQERKLDRVMSELSDLSRETNQSIVNQFEALDRTLRDAAGLPQMTEDEKREAYNAEIRASYERLKAQGYNEAAERTLKMLKKDKDDKGSSTPGEMGGE